MNAAFRSMSDLVADAEDLIARVAHSQTPEVRALSNAVQRSVDQVKEQLRRRVRALRPNQRVVGLSWQENPWVYIAVTASLALCIAAFLRRK
jgi:ElaB/YqjD/DUF883 family membrane-anchored ribosome-binding protein